MNWKPDWVDVGKYLSLEDLEGEEWKHLTMWKGRTLKDYYFISNLGRLKSLCLLHQPRILPGTNDVTTGGYIHTFVRTEDNHQISFSYHQAVCCYFVGPPPSSILHPVVDHKDSNKHNNRASNLQWLSRTQNTVKSLEEGKCEIFLNNGGWNRQRCLIAEFPDQLFNSITEASRFIGRGDWYINECIKQNRPIKHGLTKEILHVTYIEGSK